MYQDERQILTLQDHIRILFGAPILGTERYGEPALLEHLDVNLAVPDGYRSILVDPEHLLDPADRLVLFQHRDPERS